MSKTLTTGSCSAKYFSQKSHNTLLFSHILLIVLLLFRMILIRIVIYYLKWDRVWYSQNRI